MSPELAWALFLVLAAAVVYFAGVGFGVSMLGLCGYKLVKPAKERSL